MVFTTSSALSSGTISDPSSRHCFPYNELSTSHIPRDFALFAVADVPQSLPQVISQVWASQRLAVQSLARIIGSSRTRLSARWPNLELQSLQRNFAESFPPRQAGIKCSLVMQSLNPQRIHLEVGQFTFIESLFLSSDGKQGASRLAAPRYLFPLARRTCFDPSSADKQWGLTEASELTMDPRATYRAKPEERYFHGHLTWAGHRDRRVLDRVGLG